MSWQKRTSRKLIHTSVVVDVLTAKDMTGMASVGALGPEERAGKSSAYVGTETVMLSDIIVNQG